MRGCCERDGCDWRRLGEGFETHESGDGVRKRPVECQELVPDQVTMDRGVDKGTMEPSEREDRVTNFVHL